MKVPIVKARTIALRFSLTIESVIKLLRVDKSLSRQDLKDAGIALTRTLPYAITSTEGRMIVMRASWEWDEAIFRFTILKKILA